MQPWQTQRSLKKKRRERTEVSFSIAWLLGYPARTRAAPLCPGPVQVTWQQQHYVLRIPEHRDGQGRTSQGRSSATRTGGTQPGSCHLQAPAVRRQPAAKHHTAAAYAGIVMTGTSLQQLAGRQIGHGRLMLDTGEVSDLVCSAVGGRTAGQVHHVSRSHTDRIPERAGAARLHHHAHISLHTGFCEWSLCVPQDTWRLHAVPPWQG